MWLRFVCLICGVCAQKLLLVITDGVSGSEFHRFSGRPPFDAFESEGVWSTRVVPVFPTRPLPNRHTLLTGVLPKKHEVLDDFMLNWQSGEAFRNFTQASDFVDSKWWNVPPIYLSARRAGARTALFYLPECLVEWPHQPTVCVPPRDPPGEDEDDAVAAAVLQATHWSDLTLLYDSWIPAEIRQHGHLRTNSPALKRLAGWLYRFSAAARERIDLNVVFVSLHGMIQVFPNNVAVLDHFLPMELVERTLGQGAFLQLKAQPGKTHQVFSYLNETNPIPNVKVFFTAPRAGNLPRFFHFRKSHLVTDLLLMANPGHGIVVENYEKRFPQDQEETPRALSGYNPHLPAMHGLFLAIGPAFRRSFRKGSIEVCDIAALICALVHVECPENGCARMKRIDDILSSDARVEVVICFVNSFCSQARRSLQSVSSHGSVHVLGMCLSVLLLLA